MGEMDSLVREKCAAFNVNRSKESSVLVEVLKMETEPE